MPREMVIARGRLDVTVAEELTGHRQALAGCDSAGNEAVSRATWWSMHPRGQFRVRGEADGKARVTSEFCSTKLRTLAVRHNSFGRSGFPL